MRFEIKLISIFSVVIVAIILVLMLLPYFFGSLTASIKTDRQTYSPGEVVTIEVVIRNPTRDKVDLEVASAYLSIRYACNDTSVYAPPTIAEIRHFTIESSDSLLYFRVNWQQTVGLTSGELVEIPNKFIAECKFGSTPYLGTVTTSFYIK